MWVHLTGSVVLDAIIKFAAGVAGLGLLWRYLVRPPLHYFSRLEKTVRSVETQLFTNGGSTLRDTVEATAATVTDIATVVNDLNDRVEFLERIRERQDLIDEIVAENSTKLRSARPYLPPKESAS